MDVCCSPVCWHWPCSTAVQKAFTYPKKDQRWVQVWLIYKYTNCIWEIEKIMLYCAFCEEVHSAGPQKHTNRLNAHDETNWYKWEINCSINTVGVPPESLCRRQSSLSNYEHELLYLSPSCHSSCFFIGNKPTLLLHFKWSWVGLSGVIKLLFFASQGGRPAITCLIKVGTISISWTQWTWDHKYLVWSS